MSQSGSKQISKELIEDFLRFLKEKGRKESTIITYRTTLFRWYESLPADKLLTEDVLDRWAEELRNKHVTEATVSNNRDILNLFLKYLNDSNLIHERVPHKEKKEAAREKALTRDEYQLLAYTAKTMGYRRTYLLIKTICGLGIRSTEMQHLTVGSVQQGEVRITTRGQTRTVKIYEPIRSDLLEYAAEKGIEEGPIFITKDGLPMQHFLIWKEIKKVCRQMGLPEDKGIPSTLYDMYLETKRTLPVKSVEEADQKYLALLQEEEAIVGGNNSSDQAEALIEGRESTLFANIEVKAKGLKLRREDKEHLAYKIGEALPETLTSQYTCEVTIRFKRIEKA